MYCTANGLPVSSATITLPASGAWTATLRVISDSPASLSGPIVLSLADGALELRGTALDSGAYGGDVLVRMVGGAGGFSKELGAGFYSGAAASLVIADLLADAGEVLADSSERGLLEALLPQWQRLAGPASTQLSAVVHAAAEAGCWRVLPDGTTWIGVDSWPVAADMAEVVVDEQPQARRVTIATERPTLLPGQTWRGQKVVRVVHEISGSSARIDVWFAETDARTYLDRLFGSIKRLVDGITSRVDYLALYSARIVAQAGDDTLEVVPDDARIAGMTGVPLRTFLPGVTVRVKSGARILVGFENGDPTRPYAQLFDGGALESLKIIADTKIEVYAKDLKFAEDGLPVARQGDMVAVGGPSMIPVPCMLTLTAPLPTPGGPVPSGTPILGALQIMMPAYGLITSGRPTVKA